MATQKSFGKGGCCGVITAVALSAVLFWFLIIRTSKPICSIEEFDVIAFGGKTDNVTRHKSHNKTIHYDLRLKNKNHNKGIFYDALELKFYYKSKSSLVGNTTFAPFYQGRRKSAHRVGDIEAQRRIWENDTAPVIFKVELMTAVRYKNTIWKTHRHHLLLEADLKVDNKGSLIKGKGNKGILLRSKAGKNKSHYELMGILGILIFIHSW